MTIIEESVIYDAWANMREHSAALSALVNAHGGDAERKAYRDGMYSVAVKLEVLLGPDGMARGAERYARIDAEAAAFFARKEGEG